MDGDGRRQALHREDMGQAHVRVRGWGGGGSTTALDCRFLIRPGSPSHSRVCSAFSIAVVLITMTSPLPPSCRNPQLPHTCST